VDEPSLVRDPGEVAAIAEACAAAGAIALDLEFVAQDRFRPELALVQVAWRSERPDPGAAAPGGAAASPVGWPAGRIEVRLIDAVAVDAAPVIALTAGAVDVIAHAARQDLQILATRYGVRVRRLFDTQVAAAFAGLGDQIGYGRLVEALLGIRLGKEQQWTDWLRRPLAPAQLQYAVADVLHLLPAADLLAERLAASGRASWVRAECEVLAQVGHDAALQVPDEAWRDVASARTLDDHGRAAVKRLAAWRLEQAIALNTPPSWIMNDKALLELARTRPGDERSVGRVRGLGDQARRQAGALLSALMASAEDVRAGAVPPAASPWNGPPGSRVQLWEEVVVALVQAAAEETGIPSRWLATRGDAEDVARALDAHRHALGDGPSGPPGIDHPLFTTWRREVVGDRLLGWLRGETALVGDPAVAAGVRFVQR
jgi:ribonuclease D